MVEVMKKNKLKYGQNVRFDDASNQIIVALNASPLWRFTTDEDFKTKACFGLSPCGWRGGERTDNL